MADLQCIYICDQIWENPPYHTNAQLAQCTCYYLSSKRSNFSCMERTVKSCSFGRSTAITVDAHVIPPVLHSTLLTMPRSENERMKMMVFLYCINVRVVHNLTHSLAAVGSIARRFEPRPCSIHPQSHC